MGEISFRKKIEMNDRIEEAIENERPLFERVIKREMPFLNKIGEEVSLLNIFSVIQFYKSGKLKGK